MLEIPEEQIIKGLKFICTCEACPEQYAVFDGNKEVGYVRLRWGNLRVYYPNSEGLLIYEKAFKDGFKSGFDDKKERKYYLNKIADQLSIKK